MDKKSSENIRNIVSEGKIIPNKVTRPAYPPLLIQRQASRFLRVFSNITIEPALFLISFSMSMDDVSLAQMTLYKTCKENYNDTVCLDLLNENNTEINEIVQETVSNFEEVFLTGILIGILQKFVKNSKVILLTL